MTSRLSALILRPPRKRGARTIARVVVLTIAWCATLALAVLAFGAWGLAFYPVAGQHLWRASVREVEFVPLRTSVASVAAARLKFAALWPLAAPRYAFDIAVAGWSS